MDEKIRWARKVKPALLWQLYQRDALGIADDELVEEVGGALRARCWSVLLVSNAELDCPRCGQRMVLGRHHTHKAEDAIACPAPGCGWTGTRGQYHNSWKHQDLIGCNAEGAFRRFVDTYRSDLPYEEKMLRIDHLIQAFHQGMMHLTGRTVANNLIEGSYEEVVAFLEKLAGNDPGSRPGWQEWKVNVQEMKENRRQVKTG